MSLLLRVQSEKLPVQYQRQSYGLGTDRFIEASTPNGGGTVYTREPRQPPSGKIIEMIRVIAHTGRVKPGVFWARYECTRNRLNRIGASVLLLISACVCLWFYLEPGPLKFICKRRRVNRELLL